MDKFIEDILRNTGALGHEFVRLTPTPRNLDQLFFGYVNALKKDLKQLHFGDMAWLANDQLPEIERLESGPHWAYGLRKEIGSFPADSMFSHLCRDFGPGMSHPFHFRQVKIDPSIVTFPGGRRCVYRYAFVIEAENDELSVADALARINEIHAEVLFIKAVRRL